MHVFVVDDEVTIAETLAAIVALKGWKASAFTSPVEALQAAIERSPDALISDVVMPGMNGVDLALAIHSFAPRCIVMLLSGQALTNDFLYEARQRGHSYPLYQKPIHPDRLMDELKLRFSRLHSVL